MKLSSSPLGIAAFFSLAISFTSAQVFPGGEQFVSYPGLSSQCIAALNSTVLCPDSLVSVAWSSLTPSDAQLTTICAETCQTSLQSLRSEVVAACTAATVTITIDGNVVPASYIPDRFLYYQGLRCLKDSTTTEFCTAIFNSYSELTAFPDECADCLLRNQQYSLYSPFGYSEAYASGFSSTTVSCAKTAEYTYTIPTSLGTPATTATTASPTPTACTDTYTVKTGDTCESIAVAQNVSSFAITYENQLFSNCDDLPAPGGTICLPDICQTYTVKAGDTCYGIKKQWGSYITVTQIVAWNYQFNTLCGNIGQWVWSVICVSPPGDDLEAKPINTMVNPTEVTTATPAPTNVGPGTNTYCAKYYEVQAGDTCADISVRSGIELEDFYFLNPGIDENCYNILSGFSYCVLAVGSITTYTSYLGTTTMDDPCLRTDAPYSCWAAATNLPEATFDTVGPTTTAYTFPVATGTAEDCDTYRNYISVNSTAAADVEFEAKVNSCARVATFYGTTVDQLIEWNPTLTAGDTCTLVKGFRYCVRNGAVMEELTTSDPWAVPSATTIPPGTIDNCIKYASIVGEDAPYFTCDVFLTSYNITQEELTAWNPWVLSDCSGLYAGLDSYDWRDVCISASGTATGVIPTGTPTSSTQTVSVPGPTQTGMPADCTKYTLVESGDTCATIEAEFGITFAQFYQWNPAIGSNCESLWLTYAYCVGITSTSTSTITSSTTISSTATASTTTSAPAPTQTGMAQGCSQLHTVVSGNTCATIEAQYAISFATFYALNPSVGSNCESLWVGYAYCVAIPTSTSAPVPTQTGMAQGCTKLYTVVSGNTCATIEAQYAISFASFYAWNPSIGTNCENLWVGYAYCVAAPPAVTTPTPTPTPTGPPAQTQEGIIAACKTYHVAVAGDSCYALQTSYGVTLAQLVAWNPAVGNDCSGLWVGYAYCVGV